MTEITTGLGLAELSRQQVYGLMIPHVEYI